MKKMLQKSLPFLVLVGAVGFVGSLLTSLMNLQMMYLMDFALAGETDKLLNISKIIIVLLVLTIPTNILKVVTKTQYTKKTMLHLKSYYLEKLFKKDINEFQEENNGLYLSNLTNDMESIEQKYTLTMVDLVLGIIDFVLALVLVAYVQPWILLIAIGLAGAMVGLSTLLGKPLQKPEKEKSKRLIRYTEYIREILAAFPIIKNNNLEQKITDNFVDYSKSVQDQNYAIDVKSTHIGAFQSAVIFSILIGGLAIVIHLSTQGNFLSAGGVILIFQSFGRIAGPIFQLTEITPKLTSVNLLFKEMDKVLENKNPHIETLSLSDINQGLTLFNVSYDYGDNLVFKDVNLTFEVGKKYLIIGPSGQGKSTLLKLLRKYFSPTSGSISVDSQDFVDTKKMDFFSQLANIEQQVFLFEDTLRNNITLYKDYSEQEILNAIEQGGLKDVISEFSGGLDHVIVDNGKNVSGGQKSRIAIARGLITKAKIILLDEAFASLDETVAKQIEQTLLHLDDVMVINVSHVIFKESLEQYDEVFVVNHQQVLPYLR